MRPRLVLEVGIVLVLWLALWGEISAANVLAGLAIGVVAASSPLGPAARGSLRLLPLARFTAAVGIDLVRSTVDVAWEVLTPTDYTDEAIIAVEAPLESRTQALLLTVAVTLTPGTAVVEFDFDEHVIYLHLLHANKAEEVADHVTELAALACAALPSVAGRPR